METQFCSRASFRALPSIVEGTHHNNPLPQIPRRKRTERERICSNSFVSGSISASAADDDDLYVIHNSKKCKIYTADELIAAIAAETLIMLSREENWTMKKFEVKSDFDVDGYSNLPIKSVKNRNLPTIDERDARFFAVNTTSPVVKSEKFQNPLFPWLQSKQRTERKGKNDPVAMVPSKLEEKDEKKEAIGDYSSVDWKIEKVLYKSDVNANDRLMLSSEIVEKHILGSMEADMAEQCRSSVGVEFEVYDVDDRKTRKLRLKKHSESSGSFVFIGKWRKKFVKRKNLEAGDRIGMAWSNGRFLFKLLNKKEKDLN